MRWAPLYLTLPFLAVHCSAPATSTSFEEGSGGANSADTTSTSSGAGTGGSAADTTGTGGSAGSGGVTTTAIGSNSASAGGPGGSGGTTTGMGSGGAGGDGSSATSSMGGSEASGGAGATGGAASSGTSATGGAGGTGGGDATGGSDASGGIGATGGSGGTACTPGEEICDGEDNDCDDDADEGDACPEGCVGASFESHAYLFCDEPRISSGSAEPSRSWQQAMQYCEVRGLNLTLIESEAENAFVYETLVDLDVSGDVWMGATDQDDEGLWVWAVGDSSDDWIPFYDQYEEEPIDGAYNDWRDGEPNDDDGEDCAIFEDLGNDEWAWDDRSCQTEFDLFVCESLD